MNRYSQFDSEGRYSVEKLLFLPEEPETHDAERFEALFEIFAERTEQDERKEIYLEEKM